MTVQGTALPFISSEEKLKLLFRLHVVRVSIAAPFIYNGDGRDELSNTTYSVCIERNGKFQATKEVKATIPNEAPSSSSIQTFDFNETISLVSTLDSNSDSSQELSSPPSSRYFQSKLAKIIVRKNLGNKHVVAKIVEIDLSEFVGGDNGSTLQSQAIKFSDMACETAFVNEGEENFQYTIECNMAPQSVAVIGPEDDEDIDSLSTTSEIECAEVEEIQAVNNENDSTNTKSRRLTSTYHHKSRFPPESDTNRSSDETTKVQPMLEEPETITPSKLESALTLEHDDRLDATFCKETEQTKMKNVEVQLQNRESSSSSAKNDHSPSSSLINGDDCLGSVSQTQADVPLQPVNKENATLGGSGDGGPTTMISSNMVGQSHPEDQNDIILSEDQDYVKQMVDTGNDDASIEASRGEKKTDENGMMHDVRIPSDVLQFTRLQHEAYKRKTTEQIALIEKHELAIQKMKEEQDRLKDAIAAGEEKLASIHSSNGKESDGSSDAKTMEYEKQIEELKQKLQSAEDLAKKTNTDMIMKMHAVEIKLQKKLVEKENEMKDSRKEHGQILSQAINLRDKEIAVLKDQISTLESEREQDRRKFDEVYAEMKEKLVSAQENIQQVCMEKHLLEMTGADCARRLAEADSKVSKLSSEVKQHADAGAGLAMKLQEADSKIAEAEKEKASLLIDLEVARNRYSELSATAAAMEAEKTLGPVSPDRVSRSPSMESCGDVGIGEVALLKEEIGALQSELYSAKRELEITRNDLAVLEKAMDMNHNNVYVGANTNSCVGLAEMKDGEIRLLKVKMAELESELEFNREHRLKVEAESARKLKDAERRTQALFSTLNNNDLGNMINSFSSSFDVSSAPLMKEIGDLEDKVEELNEIKRSLEEKLNFQLSMVKSLSQEVIEAGLENTDQRIAIKGKDAKINELTERLQSLKDQMEKNTGAPMTELEGTINELIQSKMMIAQLNVSVDDLRLQNTKLLQQQQSSSNFITPRRVKKSSFMASFSKNDNEREGEIMCMNCVNCSGVEDGGGTSFFKAYATSQRTLNSEISSTNIGVNNKTSDDYDDIA